MTELQPVIAVELRTWRRQVIAGHLDPVLYRLILITAQAVVRARGYSPVLYARSHTWDQHAIQDVTHDWLERKLVGRGDLLNLLQANTTLVQFRRGLEHSFRQHLASHRQRSALGNLYHRMGALLADTSRFQPFAAGGRATRTWGRAEWKEDPGPFEGTEADLIGAGYQLRDFEPLPSRADARNESPVLRDPELARFLLELLALVGHPLTLDQFRAVLAHRFHLVEGLEPLSLDAPMGGPDGPLPGEFEPAQMPDPEQVATIAEGARSALAAMTPRQRRALLGYARPGATFTSVGTELGCSKSTIEAEVKAAMGRIRESADTLEEASAIHATILDLLDSESPMVTAGSA